MSPMFRILSKRFLAWMAALVGASALLVACGGDNAETALMGTVRVALTDAPGCRVGNDDLAKVNVTVERVRIHESGDETPRAGRWHDIEISPARKINLLDLTNGRLEELGSVPIPAGRYTQVRLVLSPNTGGAVANSVVLAGQTGEIALRTPSAVQSGLKIIRPFEVAPNTTVDLVIDFDACRSIVALGNRGFLLKPVLSADRRHVGAIVGFVDPAAAGVTVSAQKDGRVVRSTIPAATGEFRLAFLDAAHSPYDVVITAPARATSAVLAVPAVNAVTPVSTAAQPITLADSPTARAAGTVGPDAAREAGASVRALQAIGSAAPTWIPVAEIAHANVNPDTGAYELTLPTAPARLATFSTTLPLVFAVRETRSSYSFEAFAPGYFTQRTGVLEVPVTQNFTLTVAP